MEVIKKSGVRNLLHFVVGFGGVMLLGYLNSVFNMSGVQYLSGLCLFIMLYYPVIRWSRGVKLDVKRRVFYLWVLAVILSALPLVVSELLWLPMWVYMVILACGVGCMVLHAVLVRRSGSSLTHS